MRSLRSKTKKIKEIVTRQVREEEKKTKSGAVAAKEMRIDYRCYRLDGKERGRFLLVSYLLVVLICMLFYHSLILSLAAGSLCVFLLEPFRRYKAEKRKELLLTQFKDLLYSLSTSIAAGRQMAEGLKEGLDSLALIYENDTPMIRELRYIVKAVRENRGKEEAILMDFARRSDCADIQDFVEVYAACRQTGGNMQRVISNTTEILTDKMTVDREIRMLTAQKKYEGNIITIMPVAVVLFLNVLSPDYLKVMYTTLQGRLIMTLALAGIAAAYLLTQKLMKVEV